MYTIYTDGGCRNHGNVRGGHVRPTDKSAYAYLIVNNTNGQSISGTDGFYGKTNNLMEIAGVVHALRRLVRICPHHQLHETYRVVSDSRYVDNAINQHWLAGWRRHHFTHRHGKPIKNQSEWVALSRLLRHFDHITFIWTKGHAHNQGNIYVDHKLNRTMDKMKDAVSGA